MRRSSLIRIAACALAWPAFAGMPGTPATAAPQLGAAAPTAPAISKEQAWRMASHYFELHLGGCGGPAEPVDEGLDWSCQLRVGYAGTLDPHPLLINKHTGRTRWASGPTYASPEDLARAAREHEVGRQARRKGRTQK